MTDEEAKLVQYLKKVVEHTANQWPDVSMEGLEGLWLGGYSGSESAEATYKAREVMAFYVKHRRWPGQKLRD